MVVVVVVGLLEDGDDDGDCTNPMILNCLDDCIKRMPATTDDDDDSSYFQRREPLAALTQ